MPGIGIVPIGLDLRVRHALEVVPGFVVLPDVL